MVEIILRQEAINDLTDIWNYTLREWSEDQADSYYNKMKLACKMIRQNPNIGKKYTEVQEHLFGLKSGKHIIFYHLISDSEIENIRILHERMDLKSKIEK
jgi:toxin ParE1/3/4